MGALVKSLLVFVGAGFGGNARYWLGGWIQDRTSVAFPWNTMIINITGSLVMGAFMAIFLKGAMNPNWRFFLAVGVLGGYTTFSTFSYEMVDLLREGSYMYALGYFLGSNVLSILGCALGFIVMRAIAGV